MPCRRHPCAVARLIGVNRGLAAENPRRNVRFFEGDAAEASAAHCRRRFRLSSAAGAVDASGGQVVLASWSVMRTFPSVDVYPLRW